jgi:hypothetical protein
VRRALGERQKSLRDALDQYPPPTSTDALMEAQQLRTNVSGSGGAFRALLKYALGKGRADKLLQGKRMNASGEVKAKIADLLRTEFDVSNHVWTDGLGDTGDETEEEIVEIYDGEDSVPDDDGQRQCAAHEHGDDDDDTEGDDGDDDNEGDDDDTIESDDGDDNNDDDFDADGEIVELARRV